MIILVAFPENSEVGLILALQEGAVGETGWTDFLSRLAGMTGAGLAVMLGRSSGLDRPSNVAAALPSGAQATVEEDILGAVLSDRIRPERIYAEADLADLANAEGKAAMRAALDRLDMASVRAMRVVISETASIVLGIIGKREFDAADSAVLRRLFPYLQAALRTAERLGRERLRAAITADLAHKASFGWFLLDAAGGIIQSSAEGRRLPHGIRILSAPQGDRLTFADRSAEPALAAILHRLATHPTSEEQIVRVSHAVHLRIAPPPPEAISRPRRPIAIATLFGEYRLVARAAALMVDLFGLLPSEARLAAAIASGHGLREAAEMLNLTIETARNYSKRIFAKTGTQGQADLVRLIFANGLAELPS